MNTSWVTRVRKCMQWERNSGSQIQRKERSMTSLWEMHLIARSLRKVIFRLKRLMESSFKIERRVRLSEVAKVSAEHYAIDQRRLENRKR